MLKSYFLDRKNEFIYTFVINVLFVLAYILMFYPRFHSDLDILMQSAVYGVSGVVSSYILYSNILIGKLLTLLISILPNVPWYIIFHYVLIFVSLAVITYITVTRNKSLTGKVLAAVTVAFVGYECYVEPNYMKTSVLLCVCAAYLLLYAYETKAKKKVLGVILLSVLSSMICFSAFIIAAIIGFAIVCIYCLSRECSKDWKMIIAATLVSMIILVAGARIFDTAMYTMNYRQKGLSYRDSVEKTLGYGVPDYSEEIQEKYGLDEEHYNSISQGLFFAQGNDSLDVVKEISKEKQMFSWDTITKYFRTVPISLFKTGMIFYLIVLGAVSLLAGDRKKLVVGTIAVLLVEYFLFYVFNAWQYEWISFMVMLPISLLLLIGIKNIEVKDRESLIAYVIVLGIILYSNFSSTMVTSVREEGTTELLAQTQAENIYIVDMVEYLRAGSVYEVYDRIAIPGNVFLMNGSYGLMDEFSYWVQLAVPVEGVEYHRLYHPSKVTVRSLFLAEY